MKLCSTCKKELNDQTAYFKTKNKYHSKCRTCFNNYCMERWKKRKEDAINYKGGACSRCGYNKFYGALEFHHRNPNEKDAEWKKIKLWPWEKIKIEIDKCDLLCSNCHKEVHNEMNS